MELADITRLGGSDRQPKRIGRGRGSGHGKTCGRGTKGAGQRAGWKFRGLQEGGQMPVFRRMPKRGFSNFAFTRRYSVVNVGELNEHFPAGFHVTSEALHKAGLLREKKLPLKVLGDGALDKKLSVDAAQFSAKALEKIQAAGGKATVC